ncbi:MAG: ADP-ribose-binding protein [Planctomycetota bacterium]|jgi:hypothetical protein
MQQKTCNLWIEKADYRCILTSGALTGEGTAILDSGIAKQAAERFADLDGDLGRLIASRGNHVHLIRPGLLSFPVKQYQWSGLNLPIIKRSAQQLPALVGEAKTLLPCPACVPDGPSLEEVTEALSSLPDNVILVTHT